jgi:hypothetical protein
MLILEGVHPGYVSAVSLPKELVTVEVADEFEFCRHVVPFC